MFDLQQTKNMLKSYQQGENWYKRYGIINMGVKNVEKKKQLILLVLKILESETDAQHTMTQTKIAGIISEIYPCDRKTVGRNIKILQEIGYPIIKTTKGFYMDGKVFSFEEIEFLKSAILSAEGKSTAEKTALAEKVIDCLSGKSILNQQENCCD